MTPSIEIALPDLHQARSDCSLGDISPIKFVHRQHKQQKSAITAIALYHQPLPPPSEERRDASNTQKSDHQPRSGNHPPPYHHNHHPPPSVSLPQGGEIRYNGSVKREHNYHWRQDGYPGDRADHISNPFYVIRSCRRAFVGCSYLLSCLRETDLISVNVSQYGHFRHCRNPKVCC